MTDSTWFTSDDPIHLLREPLLTKTSDRKALLTALACWQRSGDFPDDGSMKLFEALEKYADDRFTRDQLQGVIDETLHEGIPWGTFNIHEVERWVNGAMRHEIAPNILARIVRDIFGNPFRPVAFDPAWRTADTAGIAARMYESRDFSAMPILADALEEAGCTNPDLLLHCREPGVHVRGCWVVDLVLGKS